MRSSLLLSALTAIAAAAPHPQLIDFDGVDSAPAAVKVTPANDAPSQVIPIAAELAASSVGAAAIAATPLGSSVPGKMAKRNGDCSLQPSGTGPSVNNPDTVDAFMTYPGFKNTSMMAFTPQGYTKAFTNLAGSAQTTSYLGLITLSSYDTIACRQYCDQLAGCQGFNIYYERDPSQDTNSVSCPNPASVTNIKCTRWGVQLSADTATNTGQWRDDFQVVITGSNGYNKDAPPPAYDGYAGPEELAGAINAPLSPVTGADTYMGYKFFSFGNGTDQVQYFDPSVCTAACSAQSAYNLEHPPSSGSAMLCNQVAAYVLSDENVPQGMYCTMYSEAWSAEYATNVGQWRGSDYWSVSQAYAYVNSTYGGSA